PRRRSGARRPVPGAEPHPRALPPPAGAVVRYGLEYGQDCRLVPNAIPEGEPSYGVPLAPAGGSSADETDEQKPLTCDTNWGKISYDGRRVEIPRTASAVRRQPCQRAGLCFCYLCPLLLAAGIGFGASRTAGRNPPC